MVGVPNRPFELLADGDLYTLVWEIVQVRGPGTTAISKVKVMLMRGWFCRVGSESCTGLAMTLLIRLPTLVVSVTDARRAQTRACRHWYTLVSDLSRFFVAIGWAVVVDDGTDGTAPNPIVWCSGAVAKRRGVVKALRDFATLPGPQSFWAWTLARLAAFCHCCGGMCGAGRSRLELW